MAELSALYGHPLIIRESNIYIYLVYYLYLFLLTNCKYTPQPLTTLNLGAELAKAGNKVLLVDFDPQSSLTIALGQFDENIPSIADLMQLEIEDRDLLNKEDIMINIYGMDLLPGSIVLASTELFLINATCREQILKTVLAKYKKDYDYILIDCGPSLGMLTINALTAADSVIIPVEAEYLSAKGMELLLRSVAMTKRKLNPSLKIDGILITRVDKRNNLSGQIIKMVRDAYESLNIFDSQIPERIAVGKSLSKHELVAGFEKNSDAAIAYKNDRKIKTIRRNVWITARF